MADRERKAVLTLLEDEAERNNNSAPAKASSVQAAVIVARFSAAKRLGNSVKSVTETPQRTDETRNAVRQSWPLFFKKRKNKTQTTKGMKKLNAIMATPSYLLAHMSVWSWSA